MFAISNDYLFEKEIIFKIKSCVVCFCFCFRKKKTFKKKAISVVQPVQTHTRNNIEKEFGCYENINRFIKKKKKN